MSYWFLSLLLTSLHRFALLVTHAPAVPFTKARDIININLDINYQVIGKISHVARRKWPTSMGVIPTDNAFTPFKNDHQVKWRLQSWHQHVGSNLQQCPGFVVLTTVHTCCAAAATYYWTDSLSQQRQNRLTCTQLSQQLVHWLFNVWSSGQWKAVVSAGFAIACFNECIFHNDRRGWTAREEREKLTGIWCF